MINLSRLAAIFVAAILLHGPAYADVQMLYGTLHGTQTTPAAKIWIKGSSVRIEPSVNDSSSMKPLFMLLDVHDATMTIVHPQQKRYVIMKKDELGQLAEHVDQRTRMALENLGKTLSSEDLPKQLKELLNAAEPLSARLAEEHNQGKTVKTKIKSGQRQSNAFKGKDCQQWIVHDESKQIEDMFFCAIEYNKLGISDADFATYRRAIMMQLSWSSDLSRGAAAMIQLMDPTAQHVLQRAAVYESALNQLFDKNLLPVEGSDLNPAPVALSTQEPQKTKSSVLMKLSLEPIETSWLSVPDDYQKIDPQDYIKARL